MNDPNIQKLDLRTAIAFITLLVVISGTVAGLSRFVWLSDIRASVGDHTAERSQWRSGVDARISRVEEQCNANREWRDRTEDALDGLHRWRDNCSQKQAGIEAWKQQHDRQDDALVGALNRRMDWLEKQIRPRP